MTKKTRRRKKHTDNNVNNNVILQNCLISPTTFIKEVPVQSIYLHERHDEGKDRRKG